MIAFETSVSIGRPIGEVFAFVSDPLRFPRWNSAVQIVDLISGAAGEPGSRYSMVRDLPSGRAENELEILAREHPSEFAIRTASGQTPFVYCYRFVSEPGATIVHLDARVELPGIAGAFGPLAARGIRRGVDANFAALKRILEDELVEGARSSK